MRPGGLRTRRGRRRRLQGCPSPRGVRGDGSPRERKSRPGLFGGILAVVLAQRPAARQRAERRRGLRRQRHQVGTAAERERQVERVRVVDRVEAALGQERQVEPVEGEDGAGVGEPPVGHVDDLEVRHPGDPDPGQVPDGGLGPGQPGRVRRPGQPVDRPVVGRGQLGDLPGRHVDDQQPAVPRGRGDSSAVRGGSQADYVPELACGQGGGGRLATRAGDLEGVGAGGVGDPDRLPGLAEHPRQPGPRPRVDVQRPGRAVLVRQPVHRAPHLDHAGLPGLVTVQAAQVVFGGDQPRRPGRRGGAQRDLQPPRLRRLG